MNMRQKIRQNTTKKENQNDHNQMEDGNMNNDKLVKLHT
jgi:hypothetical protein